MCEKCVQLEAETERLRGALREIAAFDACEFDGISRECPADAMQEIARRALT
jgi:hypothetical protein